MKIYQVAIVGAGPAGSSLATRLAATGHSVLLIEQKRFPRDKVCGDFVSPKGLRALHDLGCYDEIARLGFVPIRESSVYLNGGKLSEGELPLLADHPPFGHVIPRRVLDEVLFRRAQGAGAETIEDCRVTGFHTTSEVTVIEAVVGGRPVRLAARALVGADGANSSVARQAGLSMTDPRYVMAAVRSYCRGLPLDRTLLYFDEKFFPGFGWVFPSKDGVANVGVGMLKEPLVRHGLDLKEFDARLRDFVTDLAHQAGCRVTFEESAGFPIRTFGGRARNSFHRGLLVGEAACLVDPISGEGIPLALESAEIAAGVLRQAISSGDFSAESLAAYDRCLERRWDLDLKVSDLIVSMLRNRSLVKLWLTSLRVMGMTATRDRSYALRTGGILAGLLPNREGLAPEIVLKSLFHGPGFWREAMAIDSRAGFLDLARKGLDLLQWETEILREVVDDPRWFANWALEIHRKQRGVVSRLPFLAGPITPIAPQGGVPAGHRRGWRPPAARHAR